MDGRSVYSISNVTAFGLCGLIGLAAASTAQADPYKIMSIGDSLTHGINTFPVPSAPYGYRVPMFNELTSQGFDIEMVGSQFQTDSNGTGAGGTVYQDGTSDLNKYHEGHSSWRIGGTYDLTNVAGTSQLHTASNVVDHGGDMVSFKYTEGTIPENFGPNQPDGGQATARGIFEHLPTMLNASGPGHDPSDVDMVILWIGINDVKNGEDAASAPTRLLNLVDLAVSLLPSDSNLILMNLAAVGDDYSLSGPYNGDAVGLNAAIDAFNSSLLSGFNAKNYANVELFDTNALLDQYLALNPGTDPYYVDELHFADGTYEFIGQTLADQITQAIPEPSVLAMLVISAGLMGSRSRKNMVASARSPR